VYRHYIHIQGLAFGKRFEMLIIVTQEEFLAFNSHIADI
jgi:hypothetical protein